MWLCGTDPFSFFSFRSLALNLPARGGESPKDYSVNSYKQKAGEQIPGFLDSSYCGNLTRKYNCGAARLVTYGEVAPDTSVNVPGRFVAD